MSAQTSRVIIDAPISSLWGEVEEVLVRHYHKPDIEGARALYSAVAAHYLVGPPVWPMIVAPPGSMKTELAEALNGLSGIHLIDSVTPNSFLSGQVEDPKKKRNSSPSLLHRIGPNGIVVYSDFSTVLSMNRDARGSILAQMRRLYDGRLRNEYGTAENLNDRQWEGRITFLVAATPDVDRQYSMFQTLGERFVMIRWHRPAGVAAALIAMNQDRPLAKEELRSCVHQLLSDLDSREPTVSPSLQRRTAALSEFAVRARTHMPRSGYSKEIIYEPEPEGATRMAQQLVQLIKGSCKLDRGLEAEEKDFQIARRAAFDSIPATRRKVIDELLADKSINKLAIVPKSTRSYVLEDLRCLELVTDSAGGHTLSELAVSLLREAGVI